MVAPKLIIKAHRAQIVPFWGAGPVAVHHHAARIVRAAQGGSVPGSSSSRTVARQVVELEAELRTLLAPGKLAPRAAVVAALRKEIAGLRAQLRSEVTNLPPTLAADLPSPAAASARARPVTGAAEPRASPMSGARSALVLVEQNLAMAGATTDRVRTALQMVEQSMALGSGSISEVEVSMDEDELREMEALQQDNMGLQLRLETLQEEEARLLWVQERLERGQLAAVSAAAAAKEEGPTAAAAPAAAAAAADVAAAAPKKRARRTKTDIAAAAGVAPATPKKRGRKPKAATDAAAQAPGAA